MTQLIMKRQVHSLEEASTLALEQFELKCEDSVLQKGALRLDVKAYDTFGQEVALQDMNLDKKLVVIRMQVAVTKQLGTVVFADTFFSLDSDTWLNITSNVPTLQLWFTSHKHYEHLPLQIQTEKNLQCERMGTRLNYYQDMQGLLRVKSELREVMPDGINLASVKLVFYEKGFVMVD